MPLTSVASIMASAGLSSPAGAIVGFGARRLRPATARGNAGKLRRANGLVVELAGVMVV